jgi:hypothetical protein
MSVDERPHEEYTSRREGSLKTTHTYMCVRALNCLAFTGRYLSDSTLKQYAKEKIISKRHCHEPKANKTQFKT